jgi:ABC-type uncharacterized transport system substrate-binding protein
MYYFLFQRRKSLAAPLFFLTLSAALNLFAANESVLILKSSDNPFFNQTVEKLLNSTQLHIKFRILLAEDYVRSPPKVKPDAIITLGYVAAKTTHDIKDIPVIHAYLTEFQSRKQLAVSEHSVLFLEQPLERYLIFIAKLLNPDSTGIIRTENNTISDKTISRLSDKTGVKLDQRVFNSDDNPINLVRQVLRDNDLLLSLPEPSVYKQSTLKGILLSSYRMNKPVISYSPAHVKSGALAAIFTSPQQIGEQLARILEERLSKPRKKGDKFFFADQFEISVNRRVARALELEIPADEEIVKALELEFAK